ncbi:hypothetical protein [Caldalkalibacillus mannanilyticus]|uniref:hypothetical protein n=1 Tax=Caldalkalibacillus mannanilyticus TaxID=1418 RepID=UPI00046B00A2|nr:hypothetical protein [Caldalkalibacillus mannanilyticus]
MKKNNFLVCLSLSLLLLLAGCMDSKPKSGETYQNKTKDLLKSIYGIEFTFSKVVGKNEDGFDILEFYPTINPDITFRYHSFVNEDYPNSSSKYHYGDNYLGTLAIIKYPELYTKYFGKTVDSSAILEEFQAYDTREVDLRDFMRTTDYVLVITEDNLLQIAEGMAEIIKEVWGFPELARYGGYKRAILPFRFANQKNQDAAFYLSDFIYGVHSDQLTTEIMNDITQRYDYMKAIGEISESN